MSYAIRSQAVMQRQTTLYYKRNISFITQVETEWITLYFVSENSLHRTLQQMEFAHSIRHYNKMAHHMYEKDVKRNGIPQFENFKNWFFFLCIYLDSLICLERIFLEMVFQNWNFYKICSIKYLMRIINETLCKMNQKPGRPSLNRKDIS